MFEWLQANWWVAWVAIAAALAVSEMVTLDLTLLMLAGGALAGAGAALLFPGSLVIPIVVAVVTSVLMLGLLRPPMLKRLQKGPGYRSALDQLLGSTGWTTREVTASGGEVKVRGETWSARSYDGQPIAAGVEVDVLEVDGLTVVVHPRHQALG